MTLRDHILDKIRHSQMKWQHYPKSITLGLKMYHTLRCEKSLDQDFDLYGYTLFGLPVKIGGKRPNLILIVPDKRNFVRTKLSDKRDALKMCMYAIDSMDGLMTKNEMSSTKLKPTINYERLKSISRQLSNNIGYAPVPGFGGIGIHQTAG